MKILNKLIKETPEDYGCIRRKYFSWFTYWDKGCNWFIIPTIFMETRPLCFTFYFLKFVMCFGFFEHSDFDMGE